MNADNFKMPWLAVALLCTTHATNTQAQSGNYPSKPIRIIVPYAAGGPSDIFARAVGQLLTDAWGQPIIIDNRPGASGNVGIAAAARAPRKAGTNCEPKKPEAPLTRIFTICCPSSCAAACACDRRSRRAA